MSISSEPSKTNGLQIDELLRFMVGEGASDLHLKPMRPPLVRIGGKLLPIKTDTMKPDRLEEMLRSTLTDKMRKTLEERFAVDFGYSLPGVSRFRATVFYQRGTLSAVFRRVPFDFPSLDDWGLPPVLHELAKVNQGLVLITGPTGSGKSSTLAAIIRLISTSRLAHIVTIEDPIEFLLKDDLASVTQREVGTDTPAFDEALRNVLRQDPDVIMVGEMRDVTTMQTVLTAAETGHLVFSTLHTNSAAQTIDRIIDSFPAASHRQIRQQLSAVLNTVVSLKLVERKKGDELIAAVEILRNNPRVSKLIAEGNLDALEEEMENSVSYEMMQTMNQSLAALVLHDVITRDVALEASTNPGDLDLLLRKFLFSTEEKSPEGETMAEPLSDYSKILELQEIKKLYEDQEQRHRAEAAERNDEIERLRAELAQHDQSAAAGGAETDQLRGEAERLSRQIEVMRQEYEAKIDRLNARIRELSSVSGAGSHPDPDPSSRRGGFFRR